MGSKPIPTPLRLTPVPAFARSGEIPIPAQPFPTTIRARSQNAEQWMNSAVDLAHAYALDGTVVLEGVFDGNLVYSTPSVSQPGLRHHIRWNVEQESLSCECAFGQRRAPCPHIGAIILHLRRTERGALPFHLQGQFTYEDWAS